MLALIVLLTVFFALLCALAGYYISAEKGRGGFEGLLLGFLFGPFGLLLTVLMPNPARRLEPFLPFRTVMAMIGFCIAVLFVIGIIGDMAGRFTTSKAAASPPVQNRLEFELPPSGDPMLPWVLGGLGIAAIIVVFVYVIRPKRSESS